MGALSSGLTPKGIWLSKRCHGQGCLLELGGPRPTCSEPLLRTLSDPGLSCKKLFFLALLSLLIYRHESPSGALTHLGSSLLVHEQPVCIRECHCHQLCTSNTHPEPPRLSYVLCHPLGSDLPWAPRLPLLYFLLLSGWDFSQPLGTLLRGPVPGLDPEMAAGVLKSGSGTPHPALPPFCRKVQDEAA